MIRITNQMLNGTLVTNINNSTSRLFDVQKQILTGKKFTTATENPYGASQIIKFKTQLGQLSDWNNNINDAKSELDMAYDSLSVMQESVQRINDLTIRLANSGNSKETNDAIVMEIKERAKSIVSVANTQYQGNYIFGGTNTMNHPYSIDDDMNATYSGTNDGQIWERKVEIAKGEEIAVNVFGYDILGDANNGFFATVKKICDIGSTEPLDVMAINSNLGDLQGGVGKIVGAMSLISSTVNRLDATLSINETLTTNLTAARTDIEETDIIEASSMLALRQTALEASYKIASQMFNAPSLLNYI